MPLTSGGRLGPYEILGALGAGGMGEVYRARDSRLSRDVAIKVLPAQYTGDPEWRRRLEREAQAISSLSHPNICSLFDIGHHEGTDFLVMEYLEGETLAKRLARGAMPLEQVIRYGSEIAAALAAAHRKGIVHRDLKPGNVMLTRTGARLLDFGLAKPSTTQVVSGATQTLTRPITAAGTLVGTFPYMSPEQMEGKDVDQRSDIFALGAVLYEMATGKRAFEGNSPASIIAAVLEREPPPIATLQPVAPAALDDTVRGCLAKDPDERWQHAHDVWLQLDTLRRRGAESSDRAPASSIRRRVVAALAVIALVAAAAVAGRYSAPPAAESAPLTRLALPPPEGHSFTPNDFAISPDGRRVAFVAVGADGISTLWVKALDSPHPIEIQGSAGASWPFWSPDSRWVAFFTRTQLMKVEHSGMGLHSICAAGPTSHGGTWGRNNQILFSNEVVGPLFRVHADGGASTPVTTPSQDTPGESHRFPQWLPDGKRFLYVVAWTTQQRGGLYMGHAEGLPERLVSSNVRSRIILTAGHLLYVDRGTLYAHPFDAERGELRGEPRTVLRNEIVSDWRFGEVPLSASDNGTLVFQPPNSSQLVWFDRKGRELGSVGQRGYNNPMLSPDGKRLAISYDNKGTGQPTLWIHDLERNVHNEFSPETTETAHAWSGDGRWLVYSTLGDLHRIRRRATDGSQREQTIVESPGHLIVNSSSADGRHVMFMDLLQGRVALRYYDVEAKTSESVDIAAEGALSPDGQWVVYISYATGSLVLRRVGAAERLTVATGSQPRWRRDMRELYYVAPNRKLMAVPLTMREGTLVPGTAYGLFQTRIVQPRFVLFQYDVTKDGERFLINSLPREDAAVPLTVIFNWPRAIGE